MLNEFPKLTSLTLSSCLELTRCPKQVAGNFEFQSFVRALQTNTTLRSLNLDYCGVGPEFASYIFQALSQNGTLATLLMGESELDLSSVLTRYLPECSGLKYLETQWDPHHEGLLKALQQNRSLLQFKRVGGGGSIHDTSTKYCSSLCHSSSCCFVESPMEEAYHHVLCRNRTAHSIERFVKLYRDNQSTSINYPWVLEFLLVVQKKNKKKKNNGEKACCNAANKKRTRPPFRCQVEDVQAVSSVYGFLTSTLADLLSRSNDIDGPSLDTNSKL